MRKSAPYSMLNKSSARFREQRFIPLWNLVHFLVEPLPVPQLSSVMGSNVLSLEFGILILESKVRGTHQLRISGIVVKENVCQSLVEDYLLEWLQRYTE